MPDGAVHKGTRYTCSCMTSRARCKVRELRVAALVLLKIIKKKRRTKSKPRFRVNRIPEAGVKDPLSWGTG